MTKNESYAGMGAFLTGAANGVGHVAVLAFAPEGLAIPKASSDWDESRMGWKACPEAMLFGSGSSDFRRGLAT